MDWVAVQKSLELESIAQEVVSAQTGLSLLETREWILPASVIVVEVRLSGYRRCHPIEEYIIKCIASGLRELKTEQGITEVLKLDEVIVKECLGTLMRYGLLISSEADGEVFFDLTNEGEACEAARIPIDFWADLKVSVNAQYGIIEAWRQDTEKYFSEGKLPAFRYYNDQEEQARRQHFKLTIEQAGRIIAEQGQELIAGEADIAIREVGNWRFIAEQQRPYGEIWVYDVASKQVVCRVWDFWNNAFCEKMAGVLTTMESGQRSKQAQALAKREADAKELKRLESQLLSGSIADENKCIAWFEAMLGLSEHNYIREMLAEEALEQVFHCQGFPVMLKLLSGYVAADEYQLGFTRLLGYLMKQDDNNNLIQWLEQLYADNFEAYAKVTSAYRSLANNTD